jgi:LacI family transcriptional regulator
MPNNRHVTLRDVAKHAHVSYQTVSRVINNHPYVAEKTRQRVRDSIDELSYHPNKAAQSLAARRSHTLALVATDLHDYGPAQVVINVERAAKAAGYDLILSVATDTSNNSVRAAINNILNWRVDGILMIKPAPGVAYEEASTISGGIPLVQINGPRDQSVPTILVDQAHGTRLVVGHLLELGHRQICSISGPLTWYDALTRHETSQETIRSAGFEPGMSVESDWSSAGGYHAMQHLLQQGRNFTAVFVANDQMALGALRGLHEHGLRVPEDVSMVGFDDIPESAYFEPPLTTVRQNFALLGQQGIEYLIERINDPEAPPEQHLISPDLVLRASASAPSFGRR